MSQIFHPSMNAFARATIFGGAFVIAILAWVGGVWSRSSFVTRVNVIRDQPVPFSHDHHVSGLGIDCRYCHISVEKSAFAGMPSTEICMGCHSQIWRDSELLEPVAIGKTSHWLGRGCMTCLTSSISTIPSTWLKASGAKVATGESIACR